MAENRPSIASVDAGAYDLPRKYASMSRAAFLSCIGVIGGTGPDQDSHVTRLRKSPAFPTLSGVALRC